MKKIASFLVLLAFVLTCVMPPHGYAQSMSALGLMPEPGAMVTLTPAYEPATLKAMTMDPNDPFKFNFVIDRGDENLTAGQKQTEYAKLAKYFLAALAVPDTDQWVNLSPYEEDRIIPENFGKTEMGRDLLAQDYLLKQIASTLTNPDTDLGRKFWDNVYAKAHEKFGTAEVPTDMFNKVWAIPDKALVYEQANMVYIVSSHLKVMLDADYLASKQADLVSAREDISRQVMRKIILPALEKEINEGKSFAPVRQVYSGMLLATWYKRTLRETILGKLYADQGKVKGIDHDPKINREIWAKYVHAFQKGAFSMIKEDVDKYTGEIMPRKYFSGGLNGCAGLGFNKIGKAGAVKDSTARAGRLDRAEVQLKKPIENTQYDDGDNGADGKTGLWWLALAGISLAVAINAFLPRSYQGAKDGVRLDSAVNVSQWKVRSATYIDDTGNVKVINIPQIQDDYNLYRVPVKDTTDDKAMEDVPVIKMDLVNGVYVKGNEEERLYDADKMANAIDAVLKVMQEHQVAEQVITNSMGKQVFLLASGNVMRDNFESLPDIWRLYRQTLPEHLSWRIDFVLGKETIAGERKDVWYVEFKHTADAENFEELKQDIVEVLEMVRQKIRNPEAETESDIEHVNMEQVKAVYVHQSGAGQTLYDWDAVSSAIATVVGSMARRYVAGNVISSSRGKKILLLASGQLMSLFYKSYSCIWSLYEQTLPEAQREQITFVQGKEMVSGERQDVWYAEFDRAVTDEELEQLRQDIVNKLQGMITERRQGYASQLKETMHFIHRLPAPRRDLDAENNGMLSWPGLALLKGLGLSDTQSVKATKFVTIEPTGEVMPVDENLLKEIRENRIAVYEGTSGQLELLKLVDKKYMRLDLAMRSNEDGLTNDNVMEVRGVDKEDKILKKRRGDLAQAGNIEQLKKGGIDLAQSNLDLEIRRDGKGMVLPLAQQNLERIHLEGLVPQVLSITPASVAELFR